MSVDMKELSPPDTGFESCSALPLLFSWDLISETAIKAVFVVRGRKKKSLVGFTHDILKTVRRTGMSSSKLWWACGERDRDCGGKGKKGSFRD